MLNNSLQMQHSTGVANGNAKERELPGILNHPRARTQLNCGVTKLNMEIKINFKLYWNHAHAHVRFELVAWVKKRENEQKSIWNHFETICIISAAAAAAAADNLSLFRGKQQSAVYGLMSNRDVET